MTQQTHPQLLARFADAMERTGIESVPASLLTELVDTARGVDVSPVVLGVLVDPTEPDVARERAFRKAAIRIIGRDQVEFPAIPAATNSSMPAAADRQPALIAC
jgi:hypothetical protein